MRLYILLLTREGKCAGSPELVIWGANLSFVPTGQPAAWPGTSHPWLLAGSRSTYPGSLGQGNGLVGQWDTAGVWCAPGSWFVWCSSRMIPETTSCCLRGISECLGAPAPLARLQLTSAQEDTGGSGGCGSVCKGEKGGVIRSSQRILSQGATGTGV